MTEREALKAALIVLEECRRDPRLKYEHPTYDKTIAAIKEALAQPEQEPVAWRDHVEQRLLTWRQSFVNRSGDQLALDDFMDKKSIDDLIDFVCDEFTSPPQRTWVGLTDEDLQPVADEYRILFGSWVVDFARSIEAKLKEKNT